ncbi:MAG: hypothetical protein HW417_1757 [Steroidobacteraceae bacterium]|nr:hypothetical protein [Steroidobacteraceae bacterium]
MRYAIGFLAAGLLGMAGVASAGSFSYTVTGVSDYDFRGVSLSATDPALQATKSKILDYPEYYASIAHGPFKFKQWYTNDYGGTSQDALYSEIGLSFPFSNGFSVNIHTGYNYGEYFKNNVEEYFDFSAGVGYSVGHFNMGLKYTTTGLEGGPFEITNNEFANTGRVVLSIATTFPWSDE